MVEESHKGQSWCLFCFWWCWMLFVSVRIGNFCWWYNLFYISVFYWIGRNWYWLHTKPSWMNGRPISLIYSLQTGRTQHKHNFVIHKSIHPPIQWVFKQSYSHFFRMICICLLLMIVKNASSESLVLFLKWTLIFTMSSNTFHQSSQSYFEYSNLNSWGEQIWRLCLW